MATRGGDRRRLLVPQKKVWRQVIQQVIDNTINIPNDIVIEILLRLPAKSLVRLRWACKYLFDLITRNRDFAKMHKQRCSIITTTTDYDMFNIISPSVLSNSYKVGDHYKVSQCYLNYNDTTRVANVSNEVSIAFPFYYPTKCLIGPDIMGSCNGLIFLSDRLGDNLCIWNPCTKEYRVLPPPLRNSYVCWEEEYANYGFGYDHTNDDYKLVRNSYYRLVRCNDVELYSDVQVYTLGTNSWRRIGYNPYRLHTDKLLEGVFVNGALYWMDYLDKNVISFDFGTEKFRHVSATPNLTTVNRCYGLKIHVFEGSVCLVMNKVQENHKHCSEIWLMKDYAVNNNESLWTKLSIPNHHQLWLLKYTSNGEILMLKNKRKLVLYDQKNNDAKKLGTFLKKSTHRVVDVVYTESLISLNSGTYKGQEQRKKTTNNNKNKKK